MESVLGMMFGGLEDEPQDERTIGISGVIATGGDNLRVAVGDNRVRLRVEGPVINVWGNLDGEPFDIYANDTLTVAGRGGLRASVTVAPPVVDETVSLPTAEPNAARRGEPGRN